MIEKGKGGRVQPNDHACSQGGGGGASEMVHFLSHDM